MNRRIWSKFQIEKKNDANIEFLFYKILRVLTAREINHRFFQHFYDNIAQIKTTFTLLGKKSQKSYIPFYFILLFNKKLMMDCSLPTEKGMKYGGFTTLSSTMNLSGLNASGSVHSFGSIWTPHRFGTMWVPLGMK